MEATSTLQSEEGIKLMGDARRLRAEIARKLGIDQTAVVELAICEKAQKEGVQ